MVTPKEILNWELDELKDFVGNPSVIENDKYEFKCTYEIVAKELRKDFSSFANGKGGFIFFGIDKAKNISGVNKNDEITTALNRALSNQCLQPPIERWELVKAIRTNEKHPEKYVYVYCIYPSLFINRPHVSDGMIYIRQNGESRPVSSGLEIRRHFFTAKFYPEHIDQLEAQVESIRDYEYRWTELDAIYMRYLEAYLKELTKTAKADALAVLATLLKLYQEVIDLISEISRLRATEYSVMGVAPLTVSENLRSKYDSLRIVVDIFTNTFKRFHKL